MSTITGLGAYGNSQYLYGLTNLLRADESSSTNGQNSGSSLTNLLSSRISTGSGYQSLTEQLSGLVRLTRYAMDAMGLSSDSRVTFSRLKDYCNQVQENFSQAVSEGLENARVDLSAANFTLSGKGSIEVHSSSLLTKAMAELALSEKNEEITALKNSILDAGIDLTNGFSFSLSPDGTIRALDAESNAQSLLDEKNVKAAEIAKAIQEERISPDVDFTLKSNSDLSVTVNAADAKFQSVLQGFFDEHPSIVQDFQRQEALSEIDNARKFLSLSPSEMRTRLQLESIASWWDTQSSSTNQSFGSYSSGVFSALNGINLSV